MTVNETVPAIPGLSRVSNVRKRHGYVLVENGAAVSHKISVLVHRESPGHRKRRNFTRIFLFVIHIENDTTHRKRAIRYNRT
jgi:hypothetical protein